MPQAPRDLTAHKCLLFDYGSDGADWHFERTDAAKVSA
jgi:hypothetical protein